MILSKRERQVADLLVDCCSNQEIAERLNISVRTVKAHLDSMFKKYGITTGVKRVKLAVILWREMNSSGYSQSIAEQSSQAYIPAYVI